MAERGARAWVCVCVCVCVCALARVMNTGEGQAIVYECTRMKTQKKYAARPSFAPLAPSACDVAGMLFNDCEIPRSR